MTSAPAADKKTAQQLYFALPILRGLLADRSGNEDDPYSRVIIARTDGCKRSSAGDIPALNVGPLLAEAVWYDPKRRRAASGGPTNFGDALRKTFRASIDKFTAQHGAAPVRVKLADAGLFQIEHGDPGGTKLKIAIVTGAAGAIGAGICRSLLAHGFYVAATDLIQESLDGLIKELKSLAPDRIMGVRMDVTDKESVTAGFSEVICQWGGVDIIVVNAGIAMVAPLMDLDPDAFRKLEKVNVEGTLLTLAEAGRCLCRQNTGGDIVLVSTKNVFSPGAQFGAYSATKAASHQLARIASLEYAPFDIRVNMVAPDAVFSDGKRKSGLWAEIGPSRMKARGLDEKGLEEYYRNRNLLKARVTAAHVANAVLFFATRQTPTTGATIPVDGGLPDATPR